jgi:hypothetical protein
MTTLLLVSASILLVFVLYTVLAPVALNIGRFSGVLRLNCPNREESAEVRIHAGQAALSSAYGMPQFHQRGCSLLGAGENCDEACLKGLQA